MADSSTLRTMAKGAGILAIGTFLSKFIMYFYRIAVARYLGPGDYGMLSLGLAVFFISTTFSNLGMSSGVTRRISDRRGRDDESTVADVVWTEILITVPWSVVIAAAVFLGAEQIATLAFHNPDMTRIIRVFAIAIPFQTLYSSGSSIVQGFNEVQYMAYVDKIFRSLFTLVVTLVLLYLGYGVMGAVVAQVGAALFAAMLIFYYAETRVFPLLASSPSLSERSWLFDYSWPLFLSGVIGLVVGWTDTILLGFYDVASEVGVYNAALPTAQTLNIIRISMAATLFPTISTMYGSGEQEKAMDIASVALKWMFMFAFPGLVLMILFAGPVLRLLFGGQYVGASVALALLGTAYFVRTMTNHADSFIKSEERTRLSLFNSVVVAALNLGLNIVLIPYFQALPNYTASAGAALATATSMSVGALLATAEAYYIFGVQPYRLKSFLPSLVSTAVAAGVVYALLHATYETIPVWILIPAFLAFGVLYFALFIYLGGLSSEDIDILRSIDERTDADLGPLKEILRRLNRDRF